MTYFNSKYPIVCAPMNQISDINLAIAVQRAGAVPSLSFFNYLKDGRIDFLGYKDDLTKFKNETGSDTLILSIGGKFLLFDSVMQPYFQLGFKHIELFHWAREEQEWPHIEAKYKELEQRGINIIFKTSTGHLSDDLDYKTILVKGPDGAGRTVQGAMPLTDGINYCKEILPQSQFIPCGGIYSSAQVAEYMNKGALAVAIGSLFAVAKESSMANDVKLKILNSTIADLSTSGPLNHRGLFTTLIEHDNTNLTFSLKEGIKDPNKGVVFVGKSIDHINEILTVEEIVKSLI